jgi:hypothetical protein
MRKIAKGNGTQNNFTPYYDNVKKCWFGKRQQECSGVKAVSLQAWSGPKGSRKLRFPDFLITAQDGGKVVSLTHLPLLPPGNIPGTLFC